MEFQSTPPVKAATMRSSYHFRIYAISIHAAREGGDGYILLCGLGILVSIHAAREGGDARCLCSHVRKTEFQSTPPVKAATTISSLLSLNASHFNPRRP